jgi:hypothetical protein
VGVESDRLVFDYLSRVGDLAQTALPAAQRMQLVAQLRNDIERERGGADSPAAVRRILGRIGTPDEVVGAAGGSQAGPGDGSASGSAAGPAGRHGPAAEPPPGSYGPYARGRGRGADRAAAKGPFRPSEPSGPSAPGAVPRPRRDDEPDWWRVDRGAGQRRPGDELTGLPGMTGEVFIPFDDEELGEDEDVRPGGRAPVRDEAAEDPSGEEAEPAAAARAPRRGLLPRFAGASRGWGSPVLLLAAGLLIAGAAVGSLIPLGVGWLTAYLSRRLSRPQAKFAVLGIPGAAAAGMIVWIWGRDAGKWGAPIAQGQMGRAFQDAYPATVRIAAVGTALYLLWRSRRTA